MIKNILKNLTVGMGLLISLPQLVYGQVQNPVKMVVSEDVSSYQFTSYQAMKSVTLLPGFLFKPGMYDGAYYYQQFSIVIDSPEETPVDPDLATKNTVRTDIVKVKGITDPDQIWTLPAESRQTQLSYIDGLGRPIQRVNMEASPLKKDMVEFMVYDNFGRQPVAYLPYTAATNTGSFQPNAVNDQRAFYAATGDKIANDASPFAVVKYDESPLQRVLESGAVGQDWQPGTGHNIRSVEWLNAASENIRIWNATTGRTSTNYGEAQLAVTESTDENGYKVIIYTDKLGHVVLKRVQADNNATPTYLETVYIYDDLGNLVYQVSPEGVEKINTGVAAWDNTFRDTWAFSYIYDSRGRLVEKKVPGAEPVYMVYDGLDRLVLVQDGRQRAAGSKWYFTKYDELHRPVMEGLYTYVDPNPGVTGTHREKLQAYLDGLVYEGTGAAFYYEQRKASTTFGYSNQSFPTSIVDANVLAVNYYDNHDFDNNGSDDYYFAAPNNPSPSISNSYNNINGSITTHRSNRGFVTGTRKRVVGTTDKWIINVLFYDKDGNPVQNRSNNYVNQAVEDFSYTAYDAFTGRVNQTKQFKKLGTGNAVTVVKTFAYDHSDRLKQVTQNIDGQATSQLIAGYEFNELGQLVDKKLHQKADGNFLQSVDFRYNIRGWLTSINNSRLTNDGDTNDDMNDVFGMSFLYNEADATGLGNTRYYNGKLSAVKWQTNDQFALNDPNYPKRERSYKFTYDGVDRLRAATYSAYSGSSWTLEVGAYDEIVNGYDRNGNITGIKRCTQASNSVARTLIDDLTYSYGTSGSSQLTNVNDLITTAEGFRNVAGTGVEYNYDANGNITKDLNKGVTITYNDLNKTSRVDFGGGKYIDYVYDAAGNRIRKVVTNSTLVNTFDYVEGFVYENSVLSYFPMEEGRVRNAGGTKVYEYFIKDHLGNVRVSFEDNGSGVAKVVQENHYYPFGLTMQGVVNRTAIRTDQNKQLYNGGSELQDDFGFESSYSTFFREYDPALGRFQAVDPKADKFGSWSPYNFAFNDPANMNDPLGDEGSGPGFTPPNLPSWAWGGRPTLAGFGSFNSNRPMTQQEFEWLMISTAPGGSDPFGHRAENYNSKYSGSSGDYYNRIGSGLVQYSRQWYVEESGTIVDGKKIPNYQRYFSVFEPTNKNKGCCGSDLFGRFGEIFESNYNGGIIYDGLALYGTNFIGPGPTINPYKIPDDTRKGHYLKPKDMVDAAAQRHDYYYYLLYADGVQGALFDMKVRFADQILVHEAQKAFFGYFKGDIDPITKNHISPRTRDVAFDILVSFSAIVGYKSQSNLNGVKMRSK